MRTDPIHAQRDDSSNTPVPSIRIEQVSPQPSLYSRESIGPRSRAGRAMRFKAVATLVVTVSLLLDCSSSCFAVDPHSPEVKQAIERAIGYFNDHLQQVTTYEAGIVAYALIRAGESPESETVKSLLRRVADEKFHSESYGKDCPHQFYEAGSDMMMFEAADPGHYRHQLGLIANFTIENQWPSGSWYYYGQTEHGGDTSHTQYAVLGLWAASRAGVRVPRNVWNKVADWHLKNQLTNGGFAYHPGENKTPTHGMTANGVASLCITRMMLYPNRRFPSPF